MKTPANKRRKARQSCLVPVDGKEGSNLADIHTVDICQQGIGIISRNRLPLNKKVAIELDLKDDAEPVVVIGKVRWVKPVGSDDSKVYRIGLYFESVLSGSQSQLNKHFLKTSI